MFCIKFCQLLDSNSKLLVLEVTTLPPKPQPLPTSADITLTNVYSYWNLNYVYS